jgi:hypothetical protein
MARRMNYDRVQVLFTGRRFRNALEMAACWQFEMFRFLKGRNRILALADYTAKNTSS